MAHLSDVILPRKGGEHVLVTLFVSVVAPIVVGVILELVKDWLKNRHKRH
ncbi:MAG: type I toxin-antitoxin system Fst family toxin [Lactococcus lactis]